MDACRGTERGPGRPVVRVGSDDRLCRAASRARARAGLRLSGHALRRAQPWAGRPFEDVLQDDDGCARRTSTPGGATSAGTFEFFFSEAFPEPHSTKQHEDAVGYGLDTDAESLAATLRAPPTVDLDTVSGMCARIGAPTLVIQGTDERISHVTQASGLARAIPACPSRAHRGRRPHRERP
jgi:pimeloyl-ACP methyl ester carboxylesterase